MYRYVGILVVCCVVMLVGGAFLACNIGPAAGGGAGSSAAPGAGTDQADAGGGGAAGGGPVIAPTDGLVADHLAAAAFDTIPPAYRDLAHNTFRIFYGHTSHGSQIVTGMEMLAGEDDGYAFNAGSGTLSLEDHDGDDLGQAGDYPDPYWVDVTRGALDEAGGTINIVMWSWCGGVSDNTEAGIEAYCQALEQLEDDYPGVVFVYMTGHLDGSGEDENLFVRNEQIREHCRTHNKVLFDFADIETYDPDGGYHPDGSDYCEWCDAWCATHTCPSCEDCAHSVCYNCYQKGRAFWWMLARLAGWSGSPDDTEPPATSDTTDDSTPMGEDSAAIGGDPAQRLEPDDFAYLGAFRLPDDYNWGARGMAFYPDGDGGSGSLLVTGFELLYDDDHPGESCWDSGWDCQAHFGEVAIPTPTRASNWEDLPPATTLTAPTSFDGGLAAGVHREYVYVSGLAYVPRRGTQTSDKLYGSINLWYAEGVAGSDTFPTVWFANLDGSGARGMFHVGPDEAPYHGRKMGSYLFSVPAWYADQYLGGRTLVTGRARGTPVDGAEPVSIDGGSAGPTLIAFAPWDTDSPSGDLDALPMLYYRVAFPGCAGPNVGDPDACDYPGYTMCDDWTGGAFVDDGARRAVLLLGYKGLGENCYDEPPVECNDPCGQSHGYHCQPYERQVIFYDVHELGQTALGEQNPWVVLPYSVWRPTEFYLGANPCWNVGGMAFDEAGGRLFMVERGLGEGEMNAVVVHVWALRE